MADIIGYILSVGKSLFGLRGELAKAKKERKLQVAEYLSEIAKTIEETSASLKQNIYPHGACQELLLHSQKMEAAIGDLIGPGQAKELGSQLEEVWEIERLYGEFDGVDEGERGRKLEVLDQAAGLFRGTAAFVKVSP